MRFMLFMIPNIPDDGDWTPDPKLVEAMTTYNETLRQAGVLLELDGLAPITHGARVSFAGGKPTVVDGPYIEAKELIGGYWIIQAKSKEEAVEWASRCPANDGDVIEVRQIFELTDYPEDVQAAVVTS